MAAVASSSAVRGTPRRSTASQAATPLVNPCSRATSTAVRAQVEARQPLDDRRLALREARPVVLDAGLGAVADDPRPGHVDEVTGRRQQPDVVQDGRRVVAEPMVELEHQMSRAQPQQGPAAVPVGGGPHLAVDVHPAPKADPRAVVHQPRDHARGEVVRGRLATQHQTVLAGDQTEEPRAHAARVGAARPLRPGPDRRLWTGARARGLWTWAGPPSSHVTPCYELIPPPSVGADESVTGRYMRTGPPPAGQGRALTIASTSSGESCWSEVQADTDLA